MKRFAVMMFVLLIAGSISAQKAAPSPANPKPSALTMRVGISVDAPSEMKWTIVDRLTRRLNNIRNLTYVEKDPDWVIVVVAFDPFPKESDRKRQQFSMSTAFLQQTPWVDPAVLDTVQEEPCMPPEKLAEYRRTRRVVGDMFSMGAYADRIDKLVPTVDDVVEDFVKHVLEPAKQNYEQQVVRAQQRSQQTLPMHQTERPKEWPPVPPVKKP